MATTAQDLDDLADDVEARAADALDRKAGQLEKFFDDVEDLLRHMTNLADDDITRVRAKVESSLNKVRDTTRSSVRAAVDGTRNAVDTTDGYVRSNPWTAIGVAAAASFVLGAVVARR